MDEPHCSKQLGDHEKSLKIEISTEVGDIEVDNSTSVLQKIASLYAEQLMSDIVLSVDGANYPAHRLILCATSEVFQVMLMNREWSEWHESRIVLQESPQCAEIFPQFLKYFYTGQIKITLQSVLPVLSLADKYNVKDLVSLCVRYMSQNVPYTAKKGHLVAWLQYTMACGHDHVAKACQTFIKWNFETVAEMKDFVNFEPEILISLLQQNDIVVHNEETLYDFVVNWLYHQKERMFSKESGLSDQEATSHWQALVDATIVHIRFSMMSPRQLAGLLLSPLVQEMKDVFIEKMAVAMLYHSGTQSRVKEIWQKNVNSGDNSSAMFTPRLYTEDSCASTLGVDNFGAMPCYHSRTYVFSSRLTLADSAGDKTCEWVVDLYPKGVWFQKALQISWQGMRELPEFVLRTVRVAITCREPPTSACDTGTLPYWEPGMPGTPDLRVRISILIWGVSESYGSSDAAGGRSDHVAAVVHRVHRFTDSNSTLNVDDVLDFDELNTPLYTPNPSHESDRLGPSSNMKRCCCGNGQGTSKCVPCGDFMCNASSGPSPHLIGPNRDHLKMQVIIVPLTDVCCVQPQEIGHK